MQHGLLFVHAIIVASDDPKISKQGIAGKWKRNFNDTIET